MVFGWIKRLVPRGLYGRAALILVIPIVVLQLVVSVAFIQRHFEDVTRQMTGNVALAVAEIGRLAGLAPTAAAMIGNAEAIAAPLDLDVAIPSESAPGDRREWFDLSGRIVIETLRATVGEVTAIDLTQPRRVVVTLATPRGPLEVSFDRRRVSASNPHQLLVLMVVAGVVMTLVAVAFLRNQLRPIRQLARAAEAFGRGRVVPYRPGGAIEVRAAGNAFLDMRARIERATQQRTLMLSGVSHDLRTPLTRLRLGLSLLPEGEDTRAMARDIADMEAMLDAFLAFVRDDAATDPSEAVDPVALAQSVVEDARRMGRPVTFARAEGEGTAMLRPAAIRRAIDNLISNAVRYGTRAEVGVKVMERSVRITVEDDGPGIPEARREEAMRPFVRLDDARNQNRGSGVGLGLAITADIARGHGGKLRLRRSEALGGLKAELVLAR